MQGIIMESWSFEKNDYIASIIHIHCDATRSEAMLLLTNEGINDTFIKENGSNSYAAVLKCKQFINHGWQQVEHKAYGHLCYEQSCHHLIGKLNNFNVSATFRYQIERGLKRIGVSFTDMTSTAAYNQQFGDWA